METRLPLVPIQKFYQFEEIRTKVILGSKCLRFFSREIEYWQIGIILHKSSPQGIDGVNYLIRRIEGRRLSEATLLAFLKDAAAAGYLNKQIGNKKNRYVVRLADDGLLAFNHLFQQLTQTLLDMQA